MTHTWEQPFDQRVRVTLWLLVACAAAATVWATLTDVRVYALTGGVLAPVGETVTLTASATGRVTDVRAALWGRVTPGKPLFRLDTAGGSARQSALQLAAKRAQVEEETRALALARETFFQARRLLGQSARLAEAGAVSENDYLTAQESFGQAREAVGQAAARLERARAELGGLEDSLEVEVRSPVAGRVINLPVQYVGTVSQHEVLAEILPEGVPLVFKAFAREADRAKFDEGAEAEVAWNSFPKQKYGVTSGRVVGVSPTSTVRNGESGYEIQIELDRLAVATAGHKRTLLPGMGGEARIISSKQSALSLLWDWLRGTSPWD